MHGSAEGPGLIAEWAALRGHELTFTKLYESPSLPSMERCDALLVMGGEMGVYDEAKYPWLKAEKAFLKEFLATGKKTVGICLGAQLLAEALGARVFKSDYFEVGWWEVELNTEHPLLEGLPTRFKGFHWHQDTFDLPAGATLLASSSVTPHQGFLYRDQALALQFHPEVDDSILLEWVQKELCNIPKDRFVQRADEILNQADRLERQQAVLFTLLDKFYA